MVLWLALIINLPTDNANVRMRAWRALKASGAAVLRDGVYLMPERPACRDALQTVATQVQTAGGKAYLVRLEEPADAAFARLFDRTADYAALLQVVQEASAAASVVSVTALGRTVRKVRRAFGVIAETDFFGCEAQRQTESALQALELAMARRLSPGEPQAVAGEIALRNRKDFKGRTWATRARPWVDRLACAWLIRTFIDAKAPILWLEQGRKCPRDAVGFDLDGAVFSHVGARVSFEVMLAAFQLETPALQRIGQVVHFLDAGGIQPPEAQGVESVLAGMRTRIADDNRLVTAASAVFDGLLSSFSSEEAAHEHA